MTAIGGPVAVASTIGTSRVLVEGEYSPDDAIHSFILHLNDLVTIE